MQNKKIVVVLGMHRSGTSVITRGLKVMGVNLGDNLMPALKDNNDKGFWEDLDFNKLNIEMLSAIGHDWHHLTPLDQNDVELLHSSGFFTRAVDLLQEKVSDNPAFGLKDPRTAKLMLFWKGVFEQCNYDISYILMVRHPVSVVMSLDKLYGFDVEKSYMLWLEHVLTSLAESAERERIVVDYDHLMKSPVDELFRISEYLDRKIDPEELEIYKSEFLDEGLQHTVFELSDLLSEPACHSLVKEIYFTLLDVVKGKSQLHDINALVLKWKYEHDRQKPLLSLADKLYTKYQAELEKLENLDGMSAEKDSLLLQVNQQIEELNTQNLQLYIQIEQLNQKILEQDKVLDGLGHVALRRDSGT